MSNRKITQVNFASPGDADHLFQNKSPLISSYKAHWKEIAFEYRASLGNEDTGEHTSPNHYLSVALPSHPNPSERWLDGKFQKENTQSGDLLLVPAGAIHRNCWQDPGNFFVLSFESELLTRIGQDLVNTDQIQLIPKAPPHQDPLIKEIGLSLKNVLKSPGLVDDLYVEQLKNTLALHLLRKYCTNKPKLKEYADGLSPYLLKQAKEYISSNLAEKIAIQDIAKALGLSHHYFCHLFRHSMGVSPYKYIIHQRIDKAKQLLHQQPNLSLVEIALECGFSSQSQMSHHFKKITEYTPKKYRQKCVNSYYN